MNLIVNEDPIAFSGTTIADLLEQLDIRGRRLAVEVNREIVPKGEHETFSLKDGDRVEIVHAIGGG